MFALAGTMSAIINVPSAVATRKYIIAIPRKFKEILFVICIILPVKIFKISHQNYLMRIAIETYGCSANQAESEIMAGLLKRAGYELADTDADLTIVNSCIVKEPTEAKLLSRLKQIKGRLIVAGCAPEGIYDKIKGVAPQASLLSTHHVSKIVEVAKDALVGNQIEILGHSKEIKLSLPRIRKNSVIGIVPIAKGCNSACSYCCVQHVKGELFSYPQDDIIEEISTAVKDGCSEIWVTSQDNSCYGFDKGGTLPELLGSISKIDGKFRVRVGMMNPKNVKRILPELIESYKSEKIYKFLHLPIQSGSDDVLESMNRGYRVEEFKKIVSRFREAFPGLHLWTDVIVGFPGETDSDFQATVELMKEIKPDYVNISKYGTRDHAPSKKMKQIPTDVKKKRSRALTKLVKEIGLEKNRELIGWEGEVLITEKKENGLMGRNFAYKPVLIESKEELLGNFVNVKIIDKNLNGLVI
jgi:threonylcarbamoyladenosine tRNA methylthiotransferase CDKAL1